MRPMRTRWISPASAQELEQFRHEMAAMRLELAETQERLDFTERLLASGREHEARLRP